MNIARIISTGMKNTKTNLDSKSTITITTRKNKPGRSFIQKMDDAGGFDLGIWRSIMSNRWNSISQRAVNGRYAGTVSLQYESYHNHGIQCNMTKDEFMSWVMDKDVVYAAEHYFYLKRINPDIDRIDDSKGYEIGNIQLISHRANVEKRHGHKCNWKSAEELAEVKDKMYRHNRSAYIKSKDIAAAKKDGE